MVARRALEEPELFATHRSPPGPACPVDRHVLAELRDATERARGATEAELARATIADVTRGVLDRAATAAETAARGGSCY